MAKKGKYWYGIGRATEGRFALAATATEYDMSIFVAPCKCKVDQCLVVAEDTITGANTNNFKYGFINKGAAGAGTDYIASVTFASGTNASPFDTIDLGAVANNILEAGDVVSFVKKNNGTGMQAPACEATVVVVRV